MTRPTQTRPCGGADFQAILAIINDAAGAYRGVIPADRWHDPYMPAGELAGQIAGGVLCWGAEDAASRQLLGVMGIQDVDDVTLIRHAYVRTADQGRGIGGHLLETLRGQCPPARALLVGTWAAAAWAIGFYEGHGFQQVARPEKNRLLKRYWSIPARQIETSVVLVDASRAPT